MTYVALLRGINVGGNNKVDMKLLTVAFQQAGMQDVTTYINSGNVIFFDDSHSIMQLTTLLEAVILSRFNISIKVLLRDVNNIAAVVETLPASWKNDTAMKCDVLFLWESVNNPHTLESLTINQSVEDVLYIPGTLAWRINRSDLSLSRMPKLVGTALYKNITIRNCNTVRAIYLLMTKTVAEKQ